MEKSEDKKKDRMEMFPYRFIEKMLEALEDKSGDEKAGEILSGCHICHYDALGIDTWINDYSGDMDGFIGLLEKEWGWKVSYDKSAGIVMIDENKPFCVCPLVQTGKLENRLLCRCSEGFNERMFSTVANGPAKVKVIRSVLNGDESCVYRVELG